MNLGSLLPQQPLAQMLPGLQLPCFLHRKSATHLATPSSTQTPPPPGFFAQKDPLGHPVPRSEVPP